MRPDTMLLRPRWICCRSDMMLVRPETPRGRSESVAQAVTAARRLAEAFQKF